MILYDLKKLIRFVRYNKFKMETLLSIRDLQKVVFTYFSHTHTHTLISGFQLRAFLQTLSIVHLFDFLTFDNFFNILIYDILLKPSQPNTGLFLAFPFRQMHYHVLEQCKLYYLHRSAWNMKSPVN